MKWFRFAGLVFAMAVSIGVAAGDATTPAYDFKSPAARSAAEVYSGALTRASKDYKDKSDIARKAAFIAQLNTAQQAATKAGNLDEAVKIRDVIAKLNAEIQETAATHGSGPALERQKLTAALVNTVWQSGEAKIRFNEDGTGVYVGADKPPWEWVAMDGRNVYLRFAVGWSVRLEFDESAKSFVYQELGAGKKIEAQSGKRSVGQ